MKTKSRSGAVTVSMAALLGSLSLTLVAVQDWFVDDNAICSLANGTLARPFCTIGEAVAAASDGDTIRIGSGTYFENVLLDKDLRLVGTRGQRATIVDGMGSGSVVRVRDAAVTLIGLTLTNGTGTTYGPSGQEYGGGIFIYSPLALDRPVTLVNCSVLDNSAQDYGGGISNGGLGAGGANAGGALTLVNTTVSNNGTCGLGAGIFSAESLSIIDSAVSQNSGGDPLFGCTPGTGGGVAVAGVGELTVTRSVVSYNVAGLGGGIALFSGVPATIESSKIHGNHGGVAGGIYFNGSLTLTNTTVTNNTAGGGSGVYAEGTLTARNSTIVGNSTYGSGGPQEGGVFVYGGFHAELINTVLWDNAPRSIVLDSNPPPNTDDATATVEYSLIEDGWPGTGNIDADPLFLDPMSGDYRLMRGSPAIDAGNNIAVPMGITTDILGFPRFIDDPRTNDTGFGGPPTVDMGAYELQFGHKRRLPNVPVPYAPPRVIR